MIKRLLVLLLFTHSLTSLALETSKVINVDGKEITLKAPDGFHMSNDPNVLEFWQTALGKFSIRAAIVSNNGDDSKSMVVLTSPSSDKLNLNKNLFIDATRVLIRNQANLVKALKGEIKEFNETASKKIKEKYGVDYKNSIDDSTKANVFIDTDNAVSFFSILRGKLSFEGHVDNSPQAGSISYLRLKDKLVVLNIYSSYSGIDDIDWIMKKTKEVVGLFLESNKNSMIGIEASKKEKLYQKINTLKPEDQHNLGVVFMNGSDKVEKNIDTAIYLFTKAADNNFSDSQYNLGVIYETQLKDYSAAIKWYKKSAKQGDIESHYRVGYLYGLQDNKKKYFDWLEKAADLGHAQAQAKVGSAYLNYLIQKDVLDEEIYLKSIKYLDSARRAGRNDVELACTMAISHLQSLALDVFDKVEYSTSIDASYHLGMLYYYGICTEKDQGKAYKYIKQVAQDGDPKDLSINKRYIDNAKKILKELKQASPARREI